jgi:hypothetical protein
MNVLSGAASAPPAVSPARPPAQDGAHPPPPGRRALLPLAAVAALYALAQLLLAVPGIRLGWDESVYVSQVSGDVPAAYFSAPRARGITYLVAPVTGFTSSPTALHVYLALLSGAGLLGALWVWRRLLPVSVLTLGGALFASLWISVFYGPQVMPNQWCALGALAATGFFLRAVRWPRERGAVAGLALAMAVVWLMRPPDAAWLLLPLGAAALLVPAWRRPAVIVALAAGALLGAAPWVVEAYAHYGGLLERVHKGSEIQGGMGWHMAVGDQVLSLQGKLLCRPCDLRWHHPGTGVWWFALVPLTAAGIGAASRAERRPIAVLTVVTAVSMALPYLFLMRYAAPRFLLPSYALLALLVAECVRGVMAYAFAPRPLVTRAIGFPKSACGSVARNGAVRQFVARRAALRTVVPAVLVALLAGHLAVQYGVLERVTDRTQRRGALLTATAARLHGLGVRPPCTLSGWSAVPVAYVTGCASRQPRGNDASVSYARLRALAKRETYAVLMRHGHQPPYWSRDWPVAALPLPHYRVYLGPHRAAHSPSAGGDGSRTRPAERPVSHPAHADAPR